MCSSFSSSSRLATSIDGEETEPGTEEPEDELELPDEEELKSNLKEYMGESLDKKFFTHPNLFYTLFIDLKNHIKMVWIKKI